GRLSNLKAPRQARLPETTSPTTNLKPANSRYDRGTGGEQVTGGCPYGSWMLWILGPKECRPFYDNEPAAMDALLSVKP
ncbi:MAG: hypothetical protein ACJASC_003476, partial [Limimaricola cinnabarinus]